MKKLNQASGRDVNRISLEYEAQALRRCRLHSKEIPRPYWLPMFQHRVHKSTTLLLI